MPSVPLLASRAARFFARAAIVSFALVQPAHAQFVNDPSGEPASANQSRPSLAELDGVLVAAFADYRTGSNQRIRCSYSLDSGSTWIALGVPPAWGSSHWVTDPAVVASPVAGKFFVFGAANDYPLFGALYACVPLAFPGGVPTWGTPQLVRVTRPGDPVTYLFGHAAAVSPTTGRLFAVSYYDNGTDPVHLGLQFSDDEGQAWSQATVVPDSVATFPLMQVHGVMLYVMNGSGTPACLARTPAAGPTWWGVGVTPKAREAMSPGMGILGWPNTFTICSRLGAYEGRIYAAWTESYDFGDDPVPDPLTEAAPVAEAEPNETFATATPFEVGDVLRGGIATSNGDLDYFRVHLDAGQRVILWADSAGAAFSSLNVMAYDSLGLRPAWYDVQIQKWGERRTFVAPRADEYGFRFSGSFPGGVPQGYRVRTAPGYAGGEAAQDQEDVVASWSDDEGVTWSPPVRASTTPIGLFDDGPVLTAGPEGGPVGGWWWRPLTTSTSDARWRLLRSLDGGGTWQMGRQATTTIAGASWSGFSGTAWGENAALALPDRIVHAFAELQPTTPLNTDIRAVVERRALETFECPLVEYGGRPGDAIQPSIRLHNTDAYFAEPVTCWVAFGRDWPAASQPFTVQPGADGPVGFGYTIPDTAAPGIVPLAYGVVHLGAGLVSCPSIVRVESVGDVGDGATTAFGLARVWPNPAATRTTIRFGLPEPAWTTLDVLDVNGRRVARLAERLYAPGTHDVRWECGDSRLAPGVYLLELRAAGRRDVQRLVLLD